VSLPFFRPEGEGITLNIEEREKEDSIPKSGLGPFGKEKRKISVPPKERGEEIRYSPSTRKKKKERGAPTLARTEKKKEGEEEKREFVIKRFTRLPVQPRDREEKRGGGGRE